MSTNYAKQLPRDRGNEAMHDFALPFKALARNNTQNAAVSSVITLTDDTTALEIAAFGGNAAIRWVATSDTTASVIGAGATANYDNVIPSGEVRKFIVPIESQGVSSIVGINKQAGLYNRVAFISLNGPSSVMTAEF